MWKYQPREENWIRKVEGLDKRVYNFLRQEIEDVQFYSKCLDGTTYLATQDLDDIYGVLQYKDNTSRKIDLDTSTKFVGDTTQTGTSILGSDLLEYGDYTRYKDEYGLTLKNLFSPNRLIDDSTHYKIADMCTTESINFNTSNFGGLVIDGVTLLNGHRLLVKDNVTGITLNSSIDPDSYFNVNYYIVSTQAGRTTYYYYNNENGIYTFGDGILTKTTELDSYQDNIRFSVNIKMGDINGGKQFHLSRMKNGFYPINANFDNIEFTEKTNYIIRNEIDYRNVLDNQFYGGTIQQATTFDEYQISERILSVGDFGMIINYQDNYPNILKNKYKEDLKSIIELDSDYLIVGKNGILLQLDKVNLIPTKVELNTFENLSSIDFIDQNRGVIVGEHGTVFVTDNRYDWSILGVDTRSNLNKTLFNSLSNSYIVGENGYLSKLTLNVNNNWSSENIELNRKDALIDNYKVVEDLVDINTANLEIERFKFTGIDWIDLDKPIGTVDFSFDFRFKASSLVGYHTLFSFLTEQYPSSFSGDDNLGVRVRLEDINTVWNIVLDVNNVTDPTTLSSITSDLSIQVDQWYHILVTRKRGTYTLYVNQKLRGTITDGYEGSFSNFNTRIRLGAELTLSSGPVYSTSTFNQFKGTIDQVRLWEKTLDTKEITDFSNNYVTSLSGLKNWYKFNVIKDPSKRIRIKDLIELENLILPSRSNLTTYNSSGGTTMIDTENFTGVVVSGEDLIGFVIDIPDNYSLQPIINQIYIRTTVDNIKNIVYNSIDKYFYGVGDSVFRIDSEKFEFDLFNEINQIEVTEDIILSETYNYLNLDTVNNKIILIGGESNQVDELSITDICQPDVIVALENCTPYITPVMSGTNSNGLNVENDYRNSFTSSYTNEINFIKVEDIDVSNQSLVELPITATSGLYLDFNTELYLSLEVSNLVNGNLEVSLDNANYTPLSNNGTYLIRVFVGNDSTLRFRAQLSDDAVGNKVKGKVRNIILYLPACIQDTAPKIYTGTDPNIKSLYFTQFDDASRIDTLTSSLYSYIDLQSYKINNVEQISLANYAANGLPAYLYDHQTPTYSLVNCDDNGFCYFNVSFDNTTIDRIKYGFGFTSSGDNYTYSTTSYGLIEAFTLNGIQTLGVDRDDISNGFSTIDNPVKMGFDFAQSFSFELNSFILFQEDLLNPDLTNGIATASQQVSVSLGSPHLYGTPSGNYFNQMIFTASSTYTVNLDSTLNINQLYYVELETDSDITITMGTQSVSFTASSSPQNTQLRMTSTASTIGVTASGGVTVSNFVITDLLPKSNLIEWDPAVYELSYNINGQEQTDLGYLQSNGSGSYSPPCELISYCNNTQYVSSLIDENYWDKFDSKLLFLDYDIASKLYFFDTNTGDYQLPSIENISNINILDFKSITGEQSWMDYSKDSTKEFEYEASKSEANSVKYSTIFNLSSGTHSTSFVPSSLSTNTLNDINGTASGTGLYPSIGNGTFSVSFGTPPSATFSIYLQQKYLVLRTDNTFDVNQGDLFRLESGLITTNMMVNKVLEDSGSYYIYFIPQFNQSIRNSLVRWTKSITFTNLNYFDTETELITNFNLHPVSIGYNLVLNSDETIGIDPQFNQKTAYYNLQYQADVTDIITNVTSKTGTYVNKFLSFGYTPTYNILDYLNNINSDIDGSLVLSSLPDYQFSNNNGGAIYTLGTGIISFNSTFKSEWESIPKYTFLDITCGSTVIESILVISKSYDSDSDRYTLQTYNYLEHLYDQSNFNSTNIRIRVRNLLSEVSTDLQKINNIQRSSSTAYHITDLDKEVYTSYTNLKSELNFKPNTDSYVKALLSKEELKEYLTAVVYTDYKNELAINMVNLSEERNLTINSIDRFYKDCDTCTYSDYQLFTNPSNSLDFNQYSLLQATTYYTNRDPLVVGFENQIRFVNATGSNTVDFTIDAYATASGSPIKVLEFEIEKLTNGNIVVLKGGVTASTFATITTDVKEKVSFTDDGTQNLVLRVNYTTDGDNDIRINNIRVGNETCVTNCYLTQFTIASHQLSVGDGIIIDLTQDLFQQTTIYESDFTTGTQSDWTQDISGVTSSLAISGGTIGASVSATQSFYQESLLTVTPNEVHRITFDYRLTSTTGTPSISPAFSNTSVLSAGVELITLNSNSNYQTVQVNFIPTSSTVRFGFNLIAGGVVSLNNIKVDELTDLGQYYDGYQVVKEIVNGGNFVIDLDYIGGIEEITSTYSTINDCGITVIKTEVISEIGSMTQFVFDPYLNYQPSDLFKLGTDDELNRSIEITPDNTIENSDETVSLVNLDMTNYRFRLLDGLSLTDLMDTYPWILEAEIRNALIGKNDDGLVWYEGIWDCGRWFNGTWYSGTWRDGEWYDGIWNNSLIESKGTIVEIVKPTASTVESVWYAGNFRGGVWNGGQWNSGNHHIGIWNKGNWYGGTWHDGTWMEGLFARGTWIGGIWQDGTFNCDLGMSNWLDGTWNGGTFECGHWFNGRFDSITGTSSFGTNPHLSRKAIWENGLFINGEFFSEKLEEDGVTIPSIRHDLSVWKLGRWVNGNWYGGTAYLMNWNKGSWYGGVVLDVPITTFYGDDQGLYFFTLEGDWKLEVNDYFTVINNNTYNSIYGSDLAPQRYKVDNTVISINNGEYTKVIVEKIPVAVQTLINLNTEQVEGYKYNNAPTDDTILGEQITTAVASFARVDWYNGYWGNGVFDGNFFRDGLWVKGSFQSGNFGY